jgi:hypothetical protein
VPDPRLNPESLTRAWAREFERLGTENRRLQAALAALQGDVGPSDTFADPNSDHPRPLGSGVQVRFNGSDTLSGTFDVEVRDGELHILVNGTTHDAAILPQSNNTIRIRRLPRRRR